MLPPAPARDPAQPASSGDPKWQFGSASEQLFECRMADRKQPPDATARPKSHAARTSFGDR